MTPPPPFDTTSIAGAGPSRDPSGRACGGGESAISGAAAPLRVGRRNRRRHLARRRASGWGGGVRLRRGGRFFQNTRWGGLWTNSRQICPLSSVLYFLLVILNLKDFVQEAANAKHFAELFLERPDVTAPAVYDVTPSAPPLLMQSEVHLRPLDRDGVCRRR
jgi:hypothetical protein